METSCAGYPDLLLDLVYGELDAARAAEVEQHLAGCAECRAELARLEKTRRAYAPLLVAKPGQIPAPSADLPLLAAARAKAAALANPAAQAAPPHEAQVIALADRAPKIVPPARVDRAGNWRGAIGGALAACLALAVAAAIWHGPVEPGKVAPHQPGELTPVSVASAKTKHLKPLADAPVDGERAEPDSSTPPHGDAAADAAPLEQQAAAARSGARLVEAIRLYVEAAHLRKQAGDPASTHQAARDLADAIALEVTLGRTADAVFLRAELGALSPPQMAERVQVDALLERQMSPPARSAAKKPSSAADDAIDTSF